MQKLAVTSVLRLWMAVPATAHAAVREKLGVQYGSAGGDHLIPYNQFDGVVQVTADWVRERL